MRRRPENTLLGRVERFIRQNGLCHPGDRLLVACSGGPDSIALLDLLRSLSASLGVSLGVLHVDHGQYEYSHLATGILRRRCRRLGLPFHACRLEPPELPPGSNEALCRSSRYRVFRDVATTHGYEWVATGHTQTDQVETILMRILRGTGTGGLVGILPKRGPFIRPLLSCTREDLLAHLKSRRLTWVEDPTNRNKRFLRNRVRNVILPLLRRRVNPAVDQALLRLSKSAGRDDDLLAQMTDGVQPKKLDDSQVALHLSYVENLHDAVLSRLFLKMLRQLLPPGANLEQFHLERLFEMLRDDRRGPSWSIDLPGGVDAGVENNNFYFRLARRRAAAGFRIVVSGAGVVSLPDRQEQLTFRLLENWADTGAGPNHAFFDAEMVPFPLMVRSWQRGDRLARWGGGGSRKVARLLMDAKIPRSQRPSVPILLKDEKVLWLAGLRRSDIAPVSEGTRTILSVEFSNSSSNKEPF